MLINCLLCFYFGMFGLWWNTNPKASVQWGFTDYCSSAGMKNLISFTEKHLKHSRFLFPDSGPFRRFSTRVWQNARVNTVRRVTICIFLFLRFHNFIKGTLTQIWKSANIFDFTWKYFVEDFTLKHLLRFEICAREICEKFVYKHSETIESDKN